VNGWYLDVARGLISTSAGAAGYGTQQAMSGARSGSIQVAFVITDSTAAEQAFAIAVGAAMAAVAWLLFGLVVDGVRRVLRKPRDEGSPPEPG